MQASDIMTRDVISTAADTPVREVARLLLEHGISAVPVLGPDGSLRGMVSEGDLARRDDLARVTRRDWWLRLVADGAAPDSKLLAQLQDADRTAADVMAAPVVSVSETTDLREVAQLLADHHIKRVPVMRDGKIVGIVSRADLLRVVAAGPSETAAPAAKHTGRGFLLNLFGEYHRPAWETIPPQYHPDDAAPPTSDAASFRALVGQFHESQTRQRSDQRHAQVEQSAHRAAELLDTHLTEDQWQDLLHHAQAAAAAGQKEFQLLRFPNALCTDGGRAIDVAEESWPATLRGEAAELYLRWERELKLRGFHLSARVLEYPDGKPGDIGLVLIWGE